MTRNYLATWRARRAIKGEMCECDGGPRIGLEKGCAKCEQIDRDNHHDEKTSSALRRQLAHYDFASMAELAHACNVTEEQAGSAMRSLLRNNEVEKIGSSNQTEYRLVRAKRRAA